jgi:hypothetical protein
MATEYAQKPDSEQILFFHPANQSKLNLANPKALLFADTSG